MQVQIQLPNDATPQFVADVIQSLYANTGLKSFDTSLGAFADDDLVLRLITFIVPTLRISSLVRQRLRSGELQSQISQVRPSAIRIKSNGILVMAEPILTLPQYDWNERPDDCDRVHVWTVGPLRKDATAAVLAAEADTKKRIEQSLQETVSDKSCQFHLCTSYHENGCEHLYSARVPKTGTSALLASLCEHLVLRVLDVTSRVERLASELPRSTGGTPVTAEEMASQQFGQMIPFGSMYSIGPDHFSFPVPNIPGQALLKVISTVLSQRDSLQHCFLGRSCIPWKSEQEVLSARTPGNFFRLGITPKKIELELGVEQYVEKDPPTKQFKQSIRNVLSQFELTFR